MKPAPFDYRAPATVDEALALLRDGGDGALPLAGGQSLVPMLNMRLARPDLVVDLNRIPGLAGITVAGSELCIGAMARHRDLERDPAVAAHVPLLAETARLVAHVQIRTRGTIGGSLVNAAPAAEWPAAAAVLDATLVVRSTAGERRLGIGEFFTGAMTTALAPGEILTEIRIPIPPPGAGSAFEELSRRHGDFALAGAAALIVLDRENRVAEARVALCGMAAPGARLAGVEASLAGAALDGEDLDRLEAAVAAAAGAGDDVQMSAASRREAAGALARRAVVRAAERARAGGGDG